MACVSPASFLHVIDIHILTTGGVRACASRASNAGGSKMTVITHPFRHIPNKAKSGSRLV